MKLLRHHGIGGEVAKWLQALLSNRCQQVVVNGEASGWRTVTSGVPQGSVLGPCLFLIYINLIDECLESGENSFISKFADDTKLGRVVRTVDEKEVLQDELNKLSRWCQDWAMGFNSTKCKIMHFGKRNRKFKYTLGGFQLEESQKEKDVGVIINNKLTPFDQCAQAAKRANQALGMLKRSFKFRDMNIWPRLYKAIVRSKLEYCNTIWRPTTKRDREVLERVQKRAMSCIHGLEGLTYEEKLYRCKITNLEERRDRGDMLQTYKIIHKKDDTGSYQHLEMVDTTRCGSQTRQNSDPHNVKQPKAKTAYGQRRFAARIAKKWNDLPKEIKSAPSVDSFKNKYDSYMRAKKEIELKELRNNQRR